ncbi:hypothetical protein [Chryseobacterium wanjuense]
MSFIGKDEATINTVLNRKESELVSITPFGIAERMELSIYNDINILFGSKGTGKTDILKGLSEYYNSIGYRTSVYQSSNKHLDEEFDLRGLSFNTDLSSLGINECNKEIELIKNATEVGITSLSKYKQHFSEEETNRIAKKLTIKSINHFDEENLKRKVLETKEVLTNFNKIKKYVSTNVQVQELIDLNLIEELLYLLEKILNTLKEKINDKYLEAKSIELLNNIVTIFNAEITKKTGIPQKPTTTGFAEYARNRIRIEKATNTIIASINTVINPIDDYAGKLGEKGELYCRTNLKIQDGQFVNGSYSTVKNINKTPQKILAQK